MEELQQSLQEALDQDDNSKWRSMLQEALERSQKQQRQPQVGEQLALHAAGFKAPYVGGFCASLLGKFDGIIKEGKAPHSKQYSYMVPVVQSSGFGKTRSLLELSRYGVFVFYINCQDKDRYGIPLRSPEADSLRVDNDRQALGLIRAVLQQLRKFLEDRAKKLAKMREELAKKEAELAKHNQLEKLQQEGKRKKRRRKALRAQIQKAESDKVDLERKVERFSMSTRASVRWTNDQVLLARDQESRQARGWMTRWLTEKTAEVKDVKEAFAKLAELGLRQESLGLQVLFVFDECSGLFRDSSGFSSGHFIRRSFEHVPGLMAAMVDTKADLAIMASPAPREASPAPRDPSRRIFLGEKTPIHPICQLETIHRLNLSQYVGQQELPPELLYTVGRPLWHAAMAGEGADVRQLVELAESKLLGGCSASEIKDVKAGKVTLEAAMAVLSACLSLAVVPQSRLASTLAGAYMNPVVEISPDRTSMMIMDAWDPVMSAAGKNVFGEAKFRLAALDHLLKASEDFLIDEGKNGELVCRYILLRAMLRAENETATVKAFITELVGQENADRMDELGALKDYVLNFDSFVPITFTPLLEHLTEAYLLRKALICEPQQSRFDALIPVKGPGNAVSMIGLQFKSWKDEKDLSHEGSDYMDPLAAGFPEFESFATVLLQNHPRDKPTCVYKCVARAQGEPAPVNLKPGKPPLLYGITSRQASYVLDGLGAVSFLKEEEEANERGMLERLLTCRRLEKYKRLEYFYHLACIVEGPEAGKEKAGDGGTPRKKRKTSAGGRLSSWFVKHGESFFYSESESILI